MSRRWADRWRDGLDHAHGEAQRRLHRGGVYHRSGRVVDVRVEPGRMAGRVQGSRSTPYAVRIDVPVLEPQDWDRVVAVVAAQARHSARLLAGLAPDGLEDDLDAAGVRLFPAVAAAATDCECADPLAPCAHAVALWHAFADRLADEPALLLHLRGRGRQGLLADVAVARQAGRPGRPVGEGVAIADLPVAGWWTSPRPLEDVVVPPGSPPVTPAPALRLAGDPPGWMGAVGAWDLLHPLVRQAGRWAETIAEGG